MTIKKLIAVFGILITLGICGLRLWGIDHGYALERQLKTDMMVYKPFDNRPGEINPPGGSYSRQDEIPAAGDGPNTPIRLAKREVNADIAGWLEIPGTEIDYAFVAGKDNEFYLTHGIDGERAAAGSIFLDARCGGDFSGFNSILYGHSMKNGSMFGSLKSFESEYFFSQNQRGELRLPGRTIALDIFAVMIIRGDDPVIYGIPEEWREDSEFEFMAYVRNNAEFYRETDFRSGDRVLTLSTCAYDFKDARLVVLAKLLET